MTTQRHRPLSTFGLWGRVAKWYICIPKIPILVNFWGPCNGKFWYVWRSFGIFNDHLVLFVVLWYIFPYFGTLYQWESCNLAFWSFAFLPTVLSTSYVFLIFTVSSISKYAIHFHFFNRNLIIVSLNIPCTKWHCVITKCIRTKCFTL
jgi:hypothetical protein